MAEKVVENAYLMLENLCLLPTQFLLLVRRKKRRQSGGSICFYCANITKQITADRLSFTSLQKAIVVSFTVPLLKKTCTHHFISTIILPPFHLKHTHTDLDAFFSFQYFGIGRLLLLFQFGL